MRRAAAIDLMVGDTGLGDTLIPPTEVRRVGLLVDYMRHSDTRRTLIPECLARRRAPG